MSGARYCARPTGALLGLLIAALPLTAAPLAVPALPSAEEPVRASLAAELPSIRPGEAFTVELTLDIADGWHVYGPAPEGTGLPTTVVWELPPGFTAQPLDWPKPGSFTLLGVESQGYSGRLVLRARILPPGSIASGAAVPIRARVEWLACRVECMPGAASLEIALPVAGAPGRAGGGVGLALAILLAFAGGLILNLMPCVLPVLSLKALSFAKLSAADPGGERIARGSRSAGAPRSARDSRLAIGLYYGAGILVSFWLFAGILLALRAGGRAAGWGFQLQDPVFVAAAAILFFLLALNLFGVFEVGAALTRLGSIGRGDPGGRGAAASSFLGGMLATAVATPCTAPFMGVALGYALSHNAASALGVFTALGLGLAAPLVALSALPGLARRLPRPGPWMATFRQALGFPMLAAVVWMAFVLAGLGGATAVISLLEGLLAAGLGAWAWGTWGGMDRPGRSRLVAAIAAAALLAGGFLAAIRDVRLGSRPGAAGAPAAGGSVLAGAAAKAPADAFWQPWSEAALADLRKRGIPVFVDFTAAWCLSCQVNEAVALDSKAVRERFAELGVAALKADWTAKDEPIARALAALGRASVPVYALYVPGASAPLLLPEILTPGIVLGYLDANIAARPTR